MDYRKILGSAAFSLLFTGILQAGEKGYYRFPALQAPLYFPIQKFLKI